MKVQELSGAMLDYWVAKAEGWEDDRPQDLQMKKRGIVPNAGYSQGYSRILVGPRPERGMQLNNLACFWSPSTMWHVGGPVIERERIYTEPIFGNTDQLSHWDAGCYSRAGTPDHFAGEWANGKGGTALEAAMRAFVASRFGEELPAHPAAQQQEEG